MIEERQRLEESGLAFHFESEAERQKKQEKESELKEFGETDIAFSLSKPKIEYLCHERAAELQEETCLQELQKTGVISNSKKDLTNVQTSQTSVERAVPQHQDQT